MAWYRTRVFVTSLLALTAAAAGILFFSVSKTSLPPSLSAPEARIPVAAPEEAAEPIQDIPTESKRDSGFVPPLSRAAERVTKKPFGIFITKSASPVQPERFAGYHTGTDFEVFPEETDVDVPISAICDGKLLDRRFVSGYGGVAVQSCINEGRPVAVVYGHLQLPSIVPVIGQSVRAGEHLGSLGEGYSAETDGERKHLHLGIHTGVTKNIRGYVERESELSDWIDPCTLVCHP